MMPRSIAILLLLAGSFAANAADQAPPAPPAQQTRSEPAAAPAPESRDRDESTGSSANAAATQPQNAPASARSGPAADRLDLDTTVVTGNRELPKVLYIVPWKKAELGDLPGQPFNTLLDEALTPLDRDVFRREVTYYGAVSSAAPAPPSTAGGTEK